MKLKLFFAGAFCSVIPFFAACGGESSSSSPNEDESLISSGSTETLQSDSTCCKENTSSSSITALTSSSSDGGLLQGSVNDLPIDKSSYARTYSLDIDGFATIQEVYQKLSENEQVVFLIRHAERESGLGVESPLTEKGEATAIEVGKDLAGEGAFSYASSGFVRTTNTCLKIAEGRGETAQVESWGGLDGNWFVAVEDLETLAKNKGGTQTVVAKWVYTGFCAEWFYELKNRAEQYINEIIVPSMAGKNKVSVYCTHDLLVMPMVAYVSSLAIDMQINASRRWINYMAGVAVIKGSGSIRLIPIKSTKSGIQGKGATILEE